MFTGWFLTLLQLRISRGHLLPPSASRCFWEPCYIAVAQTRITGNTVSTVTSHGVRRDRYCCLTSLRIRNICHVIPSHCCVTSSRRRCIATVHARTRNTSTVLLRGACVRTFPQGRCPAMPWANPSQYISVIWTFRKGDRMWTRHQGKWLKW
jgi:hypothetical protein